MTAPTASEPEGTAERRMLRDALRDMAAGMHVRPTGDAVFGWRDRSIGTLVERGPERLWLRVVWSRTEWARGSWWDGNRASGAIRFVTKPSVLVVREQASGPVMLRAELMTLMEGWPCSPTPALQGPGRVDARWWDDLRQNLALIAATPTTRRAVDPESVRRRIGVFFGVEATTDPRRWRSSHGDLHWNNLHREPFGIVDWEAWGLAPRGYDAAFLLCHSLAVPEVAEEISRRFRDDLETDDGVVAQLYILTKLLTRADGGEHPELVRPIHRHADRLIGRASVAPPRPHAPTQGVNP